jgi:L-rhamnose mutarotase
MARHLYLMQCKPGCEKEYVERHKAVFPELLASLKRVGVRDYSIFMRGTQLYAYMVVDDFKAAMKELSDDPANRRWQEFMEDIMVTEGESAAVDIVDNEVFYLP